VGRTSDRAAFVSGILERWGGVNALVNNAGRGPRVRADLLEAAEDSFDEVLRTNLQGPYFLTQTIARALVAARRKNRESSAAIVFVTSVSATMASVNRGEYCVSKAGLAMAARLFAARLAEHGIPVYDVRPGIIATDMTEPVREMYERRIADGLVPERRWGTPDDVGRVVAALLRGDLPYATGSVIHVDGGLSIPRLYLPRRSNADTAKIAEPNNILCSLSELCVDRRDGYRARRGRTRSSASRALASPGFHTTMFSSSTTAPSHSRASMASRASSRRASMRPGASATARRRPATAPARSPRAASSSPSCWWPSA